MNDDDLRLAPAGASDAECAVCLHKTLNRIVVGDGHVPICSDFCLQAWPRVRNLLDQVAAYEEALAKTVENAHRDACASEHAAAAKVALHRADVPPEVHESGWQWRPTDPNTAFAPPFGTIRVCRACGCLVAGGPTACSRCVAVEGAKR